MALWERFSLKQRDNPVVFMDIELEGQPIGRIVVELFAHAVPKTAENMRQMCTGEYRQNQRPVGYKNTTFHRIVPGICVQGGDVVRGDGTGSTSIYGPSFPDEDLTMSHDQAGIVSMANTGPHTNGSQFFITCAPLPDLNGKHVIVGQVVQGMTTVHKLEHVPVSCSQPTMLIRVSECGQL